VQVPTATSDTVVPETVQIVEVVDEKLTASPEDAAALIAKGEVPNNWFPNAPKVIVCPDWVTWKL